MAELKNNINTMIGTLKLTTDVNTEQDWLKTNLARFTNMLQGQRDLTTVGRLLLTELTPLVNAHMGVIYQVENEDNPQLRLLSSYAGDGTNPHPQFVQFSEGLIGQCAMDKRQRLVSDIPSDAVPINSALLRVIPKNLVVLPHISCDDPRYIDYLLDFWFENFERFLAGKKLKNVVDRKLGY